MQHSKARPGKLRRFKTNAAKSSPAIRAIATQQAEPPIKRQQGETRCSVGLPPALVSKVELYAKTADLSKSKAIAALVHLGLESQGARKREFFKKLKENPADDDEGQQDRLVDEFRALILGR